MWSRPPPCPARPDSRGSPPGRPEAPYGYTLAGAPRKYPRRDPVTGKLPGPTRDRNGLIMETKVAHMRSVHPARLPDRLGLKARR